MGIHPLPPLGGSPTYGGTDKGTSEAAVIAIEVFLDDPRIMKELPPGTEGDEELPLRAEDLGMVSLSSWAATFCAKMALFGRAK
jgi:hypothetical protein